MINSILRDVILKNYRLKRIYTEYRRKKGEILTPEESKRFLDEADKVLVSQVLPKRNFRIGIVYEGTQYSNCVKVRDYNPKYVRFCKNNNIDYEFYNILSSDWIKVAKKFDLIIWHTDSTPSLQKIALDKIYIIEKKLNIKCYPSFDEIWSYEEKVNCSYIYEIYDLPKINTFLSHDKKEALSYIESTQYPLISKINTGSSSHGVKKINNKREAKKLVDQIFSYKGGKTYFPYSRQKDYVYFQEFVENAGYDLRIIVIGEKLFGYYRYPKENDFKASGSGIYEKKEIPKLALDLAYHVKQCFGSTMLATDLLYNQSRNEFQIIESSIFIGIDSCEQLAIDGVPGYYFKKGSEYEFIPGKYWLQELVMQELLNGIVK
ncbi:ATP-grasp domain-containing protein [Vibrio vulnificus]|uniref:ATP-grasp domain-containing protein n=1 Tax=Vibrio vulnificus TaxID=672 RepID=UPI003ED849D3